MIRPTPQVAIDFIKEREALVLNIRVDSAGVKFTGYGHNVLPGEGAASTKENADTLLCLDLDKAEHKLAEVLSNAAIERLSDHQYAALISFAFNLGANPDWTIWKLVEAGQYDQVPAQLMRFTKVHKDGKVIEVAGLRNRRAAEVLLWNTSDLATPFIQPNLSSASLRVSETPPAPLPAKPMAGVSLATKIIGTATAVGAAATQVSDLLTPHAASFHVLTKLLPILTAVIVVCGIISLIVHDIQDAKAKL